MLQEIAWALGGVLKNSMGEFVAAKTVFSVSCYVAREVEAVVVREILNWLKELSVDGVEEEMNSQYVFNALICEVVRMG